MDEYVKKDEVIKLIREDKVEITPNLLTIAMLAAPNGYSVEDCYKAINDTCDRHIKEIRNLPAADVVERKKGMWEEREVIDIEDTTIEDVQSQRCSICGRYLTTPYLYYFKPYNFCPNCGADCRGGTDGEV